ncbi:TPA: hypothetical protein N0F65_013016 [Lagenidium giganteum]|uniref:BRO1 domain-containing protein n=1 Tax=Lagenidium giganteum TaxID=4803 RepID=A0AAV2YLG0_9STRA|nr:TPA: hypothetical protein N0F65_013016 [Lagenidium giganteum]
MTSMMAKESLPPCCHALYMGTKHAERVNFESELLKHAVHEKKHFAVRLAIALKDARGKLQCDKDSIAVPFTSVEDVTAYVQDVVHYLSLLRGFQPEDAAAPGAQPQPQAPATSSTIPVATMSSDGSETPSAALRQPLMANMSPSMPSPLAMTAPVPSRPDRRGLINFCSWKDVITNASLYGASVEFEHTQALLASGVFMLNQAQIKMDRLAACGGRLNPEYEKELKVAYQLLLQAAGVFEACLHALGVTPQAVGAPWTDLSEPEPQPSQENANQDDSAAMPTEDAMAKWRAEQKKMAAGSALSDLPAPAASEDMVRPEGKVAAPTQHSATAQLHRIPDLARGHFVQALMWIALAQAEELVILRGITREFVDYGLMGKLAMDLATRFKAIHEYAGRFLPCASSGEADKLRVHCMFKEAYYVATSCYFQGAAHMDLDEARHCAQAIANFKKAQGLMQATLAQKQNYEAKLSDRLERDRKSRLDASFTRAQQIINRDLEIMTKRNDTVYYERIPEPQPPCEPLGLVRAVPFPEVQVAAVWRDEGVATCLYADEPAQAAVVAPATTPAGGNQAEPERRAVQPGEGGCCKGCVIS